jgi:hypothetical protein
MQRYSLIITKLPREFVLLQGRGCKWRKCTFCDYFDDVSDTPYEINKNVLLQVTGEYGVLFYDNMNNDNNLKYMETIVTTNPCGEYLSGVVYNENEVFHDYFGACNLGSVFLHKFVLKYHTHGVNKLTRKAYHTTMNNIIWLI